MKVATFSRFMAWFCIAFAVVCVGYTVVGVVLEDFTAIFVGSTGAATGLLNAWTMRRIEADR